MRPLDPLAFPCDGLRLIEASAGTGKTYTIATLYLRLLLEQWRSVREILVVTFTQSATEELRDRIRKRLREAVAVLGGAASDDQILLAIVRAQPDPERAARHLNDELTCLDEAAIYTIHGFCQRALQENAFESGTSFDAEFVTGDGDYLARVMEEFWRQRFYGAGEGLARLAWEVWGSPAGLCHAVRRHVGRPGVEILPAIDEGSVDEEAWRSLHGEAERGWREEGARIVGVVDGCKELSRGPYKPEKTAEAAARLDLWFTGPHPDYCLPDGLSLFARRSLDGAITASGKKKGAAVPDHPFFRLCQKLLDLRKGRVALLTSEAIREGSARLAHFKEQRDLLAFDDLLNNLARALEGEGGEALAGQLLRRYPVALIDEFQDTDPVQYAIFSTIYRKRGALFLIGDPKQAIYSFRGADIFAYIGAKRETADENYTLGTNWRSSTALVGAVNALFGSHPAPFVLARDIEFHRVEAGGRADRTPLRIDGAPPAPLDIWFVARSEENLDRGRIAKTWARGRLAAATASEIARLLTLAGEGRALIGEEPLRPRDIAVLVRTNDEAAQIQAALQTAGVASVCQRRESVFASEEAQELLLLLLAIAEPGEERRLRAALATGLVGYDAGEIDALLRDETAWEDLVARVQGYHLLWLNRGFMPMFRGLLHALGIGHRLLARPDGERGMTNLLQLAELLQEAGRDHAGIANLLRWFGDRCREPDGENEGEQLRLESDEALVKIVTIHKSKGLEYGLVFLPFLWSGRRTDAGGPLLFHRDDGRPVLDIGSEDREEHLALAERERLAEDLRLLYVALTRARHYCCFGWGAMRDAEYSALAYLLYPGGEESADRLPERVKSLEEEALRAPLEALAAANQGIRLGDPPPPGRRYQPAKEEAEALTALAPARAVGWEWRVTSYSALAAGRAEAGERPDYDRGEEGAGGDLSVFNFPRGARAGTFLHKLFERLDFPVASGGSLAAEVERQLRRHGFDPAWRGTVERLVADVLDCPLDGEGLRLREVSRARALVELEFYFPLAPLAPGDLEGHARGLGSYRGEGTALQFHLPGGMMRGFIDLVFEHGGRYFLLDYKSNFLGPRHDDYGTESLQAAVRANRYDLQYLIYTVALHRHLGARLPGYDYETHFGGVYYLFVRGMRADGGAGRGIFFDRPAGDRIARLDALFAGRDR